MTRQELKTFLSDSGISEHAYSLDGGMWDDKYVLSQEPMDKWSVYYGERGDRIGERTFNNEGEACKYLLTKLVIDRTTRIRGWNAPGD